MSAMKTVVLGDEYDSELRAALVHTLRSLGAIAADQWQGISGSQELESLTALVGGEEVKVEAETYIGLSLTGSAAVVDKIAMLVHERLAGGAK
jgi:hypothetical protein